VAHRDRLLEVELVEAVHGQLDLQRRRGGRRAVRQLLPRVRETAVGVLVPPEPVLDGRAAGGQVGALRVGLGRQQLERVQQRRAAALELP
jgi:hypothetical protein